MFFLKKITLLKKTESIGLDIGSFSLKVVHISHSKKGKFLLGYLIKNIKNQDISTLLKNTLKEFPAKSKKIGISLAGPSVVIRTIYLPLMKPQELKEAMQFEIEKHIPFPLKEINFDYQILKEEKNNKRMLLLLVAAKKDFVEKKLALFKDTEFDIQFIDVDSLAIINAFQYNIDSLNRNPLCLLNIGHSFSNLSIIQEGIPFVCRDINIGGQDFTKKISNVYKIDFPSAEALKCNPQDRLDEIIQLLEPTLEELANEVRISLDYFETQTDTSVRKIYLSGGSIVLPKIKDSLAHFLGMEINIWNPLTKLNLSSMKKDKNKLIKEALSLGVATGLALRVQ